MQTLGVVEDTLFVPMLGRIYASEHYPQILYDKKALELKKKLPSDLIKQNMQSQYTLLASASRSANMDRIIRTFLERRPDGVIVQLGCGLETTYHRCDNGKTHWYAMDLPHVIEYRRGLLPEPERELYISGDAFAKDWIKKVRNDVLDAPILVTAGGLFHYFEEHKVIALLRMIGQFGNMEVVFDTVNKRGMTMMKKKYMKQVGHADAQMFFYVDSSEELAAKIGGNVKVIAEEPYYRYIPKNGLKLSTKVSMTVSDQFKMVKMIHLKLQWIYNIRERELYHFFGRTDETPSKAAFYHQRAKLKDNALWELLQIFNQKLQPTLYRNRYRLVACDGSVADEVDPELLAKVLANPEMWALLNSLAKTMK